LYFIDSTKRRQVSEHRTAHVKIPSARVLIISFGGVILCGILHFVGYISGDSLVVAVTARLFFLPVLYGSVYGGLIVGGASGLFAGMVLYAVMRFHSPELSTTLFHSSHIEHFAEIPFLFLIGVVGGFLSDHLMHERKKASNLRDLFGRYVSESVLSEILQKGVSLSGEEKQATVLFADIRGFTGMAETMPAAEVMDMLNKFFGEMSAIIIKHGGYLDKFIGDAVMAVFGIPVPHSGDPERALKTAFAMLERLEILNKINYFGRPLKIGIGIHTGPLMAGNIGSEQRMNYTVIGDTVNVASRLQALTKEYSVPILISDRTAELCGGETHTQYAGEIQVKGRTSSLKVYTCVHEGKSDTGSDL